MVEPNCIVQNCGALGRGDPDVGGALGIGDPNAEGCALGIIDPDMDSRFDVVDMREGND